MIRLALACAILSAEPKPVTIAVTVGEDVTVDYGSMPEWIENDLERSLHDIDVEIITQPTIEHPPDLQINIRYTDELFLLADITFADGTHHSVTSLNVDDFVAELVESTSPLIQDDTQTEEASRSPAPPTPQVDLPQEEIKPQQPTQDRHRNKNIAAVSVGTVLTAAGLGTLIAGSVLLATGRSEQETLVLDDNGDIYPVTNTVYEQKNVSIGLMAAGAGVMTAGIITLSVGASRLKPHKTQFSIAPTIGGMVMHGRF